MGFRNSMGLTMNRLWKPIMKPIIKTKKDFMSFDTKSFLLIIDIYSRDMKYVMRAKPKRPMIAMIP